MDGAALAKALERLEQQIRERHQDLGSCALVGIQRRGEYLARRLADRLQGGEGEPLRFGTVDVTFHRDDFRTRLSAPKVGPTNVSFGVDGLHIILVDDVLYTGRTVRAAMNSLMDFGRPASIELAVLVDRGRRELPIQADYVAQRQVTKGHEHVHVHVEEVDGVDEVLLVEYNR